MDAEQILLNVNEEDPSGCMSIYVVAQDMENDERGVYCFHIKYRNDWQFIQPTIEKELPENTKLIAFLWTTPTKKKRLFVVGEFKPEKDDYRILQRLRELLPDNPAQASGRFYHSAACPSAD